MLEWLTAPAAEISVSTAERAKQHQSRLRKPPGSLGLLEDIAVQFAGWQGKAIPNVSNINVQVFAADHGAASEAASTLPLETTAQSISNIVRGGAAITVLARQFDAEFNVINLGTVTPVADSDGLHNLQLANGSHNFCRQAALGEELLHTCLEAGRELGPHKPCELFVAGEIGVGNNFSAAAICSAALTLPVEQSVGRGRGNIGRELECKQRVVRTGLDKHRTNIRSPLGILAHIGGLEIAALVGAYISSAQRGIPILVDGFVCSSAALIACQINPSVRKWMLFAHLSVEPGHQHVLNDLDAKPLIDLGVKLGEGTGAALAVPIIQQALSLHNNMAVSKPSTQCTNA